jgi:UDP-glucose 4-epimerase
VTTWLVTGGVGHLAAKKAAGESVGIPLYYYRENVSGVQAVLETMQST